MSRLVHILPKEYSNLPIIMWNIDKDIAYAERCRTSIVKNKKICIII